MTDQATQIGEWQADPTTNELGRAGSAVRIEPKAMEVLMALARHAGQVVSREQLLATVWAGVVVGDEALTQSIIKLRRALGDNPRSPTYIETISKRGYRLIAPVGQRKDAAAPSPREEARTSPPPPAPRAKRGIPALAILAAAAVLAVAGSVFVFQSLARHPSVARTESTSAREAAPVTVTVLPFESVGAGADQDYLARGIGSDLMTDLSKLSGLRLIAPSAGTNGRASAPGARYVVSGSVQREGATLRINVRLTDALTNEQLWAQRFERPFGDLFAIQNEISRSVTDHLPARITDAERRRLAHRYTRSLEAYDAFLRGQALFLVRRGEENLQARAYYEKALALDPEFARAYAGLAMTYAMQYRYLRASGSSAALAHAHELAESARMIDPGIPEVYWALGFVQTQSRRYDEALASLRRAIDLNPSYADAYALMGGIYTYVGKSGKSIPLLRTALRLNPEGGYLYFLLLGRAYLFESDAEQALINLREALARNPDDLEARVYLAAALVASGDRAGAAWQADRIRARETGFSARKWLETYPLTSAPYRERLLALLAQTGL